VRPDCRNDCVEPFEFPRGIYNRPGLPHIDYRIGTYSDFYGAILRSLNSDNTLRSWTHREPDDPGIALLEGAAILGDILTFYQELYANEAYLRTARWRESVADLVRLLGYRLSPGVGGRATFAFEVRGDKPVVIPARFAVQAQVEGLEQPAEFETVQEAVADPSLGEFHLYHPTHMPNFPEKVAAFSIATPELEQAGVELDEGDRLMLLDKDSGPTTNAHSVIIKGVEQSFDRTNLTIEGSWAGGKGRSNITAYKLGRTFRHFGHNAPPHVIKLDPPDKPSQEGVTYDRNLKTVTGSTTIPIIAPSFTSLQIPLDSEVEDLLIGSKLVIQGLGGDTTIVRGITGFKPISMTWGALTGSSTLVSIDSEMGDSTADVRKLVMHETVGDSLNLRSGRQLDESAGLTRLSFFGEAAPYKELDKRRLALQKEDGTLLETTATIDDNETTDGAVKKFRPVTLTPALGGSFKLNDFPLEDPKVTVYGNLVDATQGKTEREAVLGNGDSRQTFQTFKLPKAPLTYHNSVGETPPEVPELRVYVDDRLWKQVPSLFECEPGEEIYVVREDTSGDSWVQFGDGKTGKRLPSGLGNVVARYRTGVGAHGGLKEDTTVQAGSILDRLDEINLPGVASGGSEPESGENAREAAPGKIQSLDRLVSLKDFESETLAIAGVSKASAAWDIRNNVPTVELTVLMEAGRDKEFEQVRQIVADFNRCRGPQRFPVSVEQGKFEYVCVGADVALDPTYRKEVVDRGIKEALGLAGEEGIDGSRGLFALGDRHFGQDEYSTRITGIVQNVEGVLWTRVTDLVSLGESEQPPASHPSGITFNPVIPCDGRHVLALYAGGLRLNHVSAPSSEAC
jgi:hypothetical protein